MNEHRPIGIKLIAGYFFLKTSILALALIVAYYSKGLAVTAQRLIVQLVPSVHLFDGKFAMVIAPFFVALGTAVGLGVWFLKPWAWAFLIVERGIPLIRLAQFLIIVLTLNRAWLSLLPSSPLFAIDVMTSIAIVGYFLDPDVQRLFRSHT